MGVFNCFLHIAGRLLFFTNVRVWAWRDSEKDGEWAEDGRRADNKNWECLGRPLGACGDSNPTRLQNNNLLTPITKLRGKEWWQPRSPSERRWGGSHRCLPWPAWLSAGSERWLSCRWPDRPPLSLETDSTDGRCGQKDGQLSLVSSLLKPHSHAPVCVWGGGLTCTGLVVFVTLMIKLQLKNLGNRKLHTQRLDN